MTGVVYKYTNKVNGKVYIGETTNLIRRNIEHKCHSKIFSWKSPAFYNAINEFGWENFDLSILETVEASTAEELKQELHRLEEAYILQYNSHNTGYNVSFGGDNTGPRGRAILEYDMSGNLLNRYESYRDLPVPEYRKEQVFRACKYNHVTFNGHIWRWEDNDLTKMPYDAYYKSKHIYYQWTKDGRLVKKWDSVMAAEREGGFDPSTIIKCCKGKNKTCKGFVWTRELKTNNLE